MAFSRYRESYFSIFLGTRWANSRKPHSQHVYCGFDIFLIDLTQSRELVITRGLFFITLPLPTEDTAIEPHPSGFSVYKFSCDVSAGWEILTGKFAAE